MWRFERMDPATDLDRVLDVEHETFTNPHTREMYLRELQHPGLAHVYVLRLPDDPVAAFCAAWLVCDELHINNLAVRPPYRRRGFATALLRHVLRAASRLGARRATLEVRHSNEPARALYERLGFSVAGARPNYYTNPMEDALILWLDPLEAAEV